MAQMFDHILDPAKGWPYGVFDYPTAGQHADLAYTLRGGQCCHQDPTTGRLLPGVGTHHMPLFILQGGASLDVARTSDTQYQAVTPTGEITCIPGTAAMELRTTEIYTATSFAREDLLKSPTGYNSATYGLTSGAITTNSTGVLRNDSITLYTTAVVGKVSRGTEVNYNGVTVLYFWPLYCPGTA